MHDQLIIIRSHMPIETSTHAGVVTFLALLTISAPYGRYSKGGAWGPLINAKLAWVVWEVRTEKIISVDGSSFDV